VLIRSIRVIGGKVLRLFFSLSPFLLFFSSSLLLFSLSVPAGAAPRRVVLVVCERLTWEDVNAECPFLVSLLDRSAIGLMNTAVSGPKNPASALLAVAAGQLLPSETGDEQAFNVGEAVPDETGTAGEIYARRTGGAPIQTIVHLNIASLMRRQIARHSLGAALTAAIPARRVLICGNADTDTPQRRAVLSASDAQGTATGDAALTLRDKRKPFGLKDDGEALARYAAATDAELFVAVIGDVARAEAARPRLSAANYRDARRDALRGLDSFFLQLLAIRHLDTLSTNGADVILVSPCPPSDTPHRPETWTHLVPFLALGPDFPPGLLASPTTRTLGLVANIDIAPTLLNLLNVPVPVTMAGRPIQSLPGISSLEERLKLVSRLDFVTTLNTQALMQVAVPISALCFALVLASIVAYWRGGTRAARLFLPGLIFTLNLPAGLLLATILIPPTLPEYGLRIMAWMAALTAADYALARSGRMSPPVACGLLNIGLIVIDLFRGQPLLKDSLFSGYALSGIRYYGIGNEYLGVVLGYALMSGFAWLEDRGRQRDKETRRQGQETNGGRSNRARLFSRFQMFLASVGRLAERQSDGCFQHPEIWCVILGWIGLAVALGWPGLGANAGSLIVTGAGFGVGAWMLTGRRFSPAIALVCLLTGIGLSFAFGALDAMLAGPRASHAGNVLNAVEQGRGPGYLLEIMARKIGMNLHLLTSPFFLMGGSLVVVTVLLMRAVLGNAVQSLFASRSRLRQSLPALAVTLFASLLFKDSGVVTVGFTAGVACLYVLWYTESRV
jgi:hypothetical protein